MTSPATVRHDKPLSRIQRSITATTIQETHFSVTRHTGSRAPQPIRSDQEKRNILRPFSQVNYRSVTKCGGQFFDFGKGEIMRTCMEDSQFVLFTLFRMIKPRALIPDGRLESIN